MTVHAAGEVVEHGGWRFGVTRSGSGPAVLLLHGLLTDSTVWAPVIEALRDTYTLIAVDAPGHGTSPARPVPFTLEDETKALAGLLGELGVDGPIPWVGHSMGGMKAMRAAVWHPAHVSSLVLISTQPYPEPARTARPYEAMVEAANSWGISDDLAEMIGKLNFHRDFLATDPGRRWLRHFTTLKGSDIEGMSHAVFRRDDLTPWLARIEVPSLVIHGTDDIPIRLATAKGYAALLDRAQFTQLAACGHTPQCEHPTITAALIKQFLDRQLVTTEQSGQFSSGQWRTHP